MMGTSKGAKNEGKRAANNASGFSTRSAFRTEATKTIKAKKATLGAPFYKDSAHQSVPNMGNAKPKSRS